MIDLRQVKNRYYIMRHGQSRGNVEKIIVSSPDNGIPGYGLTQKGKVQADQSIKTFQGLDSDTIIYASDFLRTKETAEIVDRHLNTKRGITCSPLLRERFFGDWELTPDENYSRIWEEDAQNIVIPANHVESVRSVLNRVLTCISALEEQYRDKNILLVSHGDTLQIFLTHLKGWDPHRHREIDHLDVAQIRCAIS